MISDKPQDPSTPEPGQFGPVAPYYDELMASVPYPEWLEYIRRVWKRHELSPKTVLDLACGTGTFTRLLSQHGYKVAGVDISGPMLAEATRKNRELGYDIPFHEQDAAELDLGAAHFDAVVSLFDSLNYILDPGRLRSAFARVRAHLNTGGAFFFDVNTEYALEQGMFNQSSTHRMEPLHYRWRSSYEPDSRLCTIRMRFEYEEADGSRSVFNETHVQRAYLKDELKEWLLDAGFAGVSIYDAYTLRGPRRRSDRLFFLATT